ncbi:MAG TPA: hypothetical protein P5186_28105 [Candidatus Paceibacterota bacterium]|nr:hypothetical protein [Verrucomicrobiota bacterium]HRY51914.1 hypothetical protein [Candidatus Paceibacterota bacterium]
MNATIKPTMAVRFAEDLFDALDGRGAILDQRDLQIIRAAFLKHAREIQSSVLPSAHNAMTLQPCIWN